MDLKKADTSTSNPTETPPTYEEDETGAPPSYQSLYGQLKDVKQQNSSPVSFMTALFNNLLGTLCMVCVTLGMALVLAIPVSIIVIGNVWIYRIYTPNTTDPTSPEYSERIESLWEYCVYALYCFSFWITTAAYIVMGVGCSCCCGVGCVAVMNRIVQTKYAYFTIKAQ